MVHTVVCTLYDKTTDTIRPELLQVNPSVRVEVTDDELLPVNVNEITVIEIQIGRDNFNWDVFVATIREDTLIGYL
jgi:hypothetical protein